MSSCWESCKAKNMYNSWRKWDHTLESEIVSSIASRILYHCAGCDRDAGKKRSIQKYKQQEG